MLYLASQFMWFLLAAFALGLAMGWISRDGGKARLWNGAWLLIAALWAVGAALTWFQWLNGSVATWIETALLFVAAYWAGCACMSLVARPALATAGQPSLPASAPAAASPVSGSLSTGASKKNADGRPHVENEAEFAGLRPHGQAEARGGKADDLEVIKGIGPQNAGRLHRLGIWHFEQIAAWTPENIEWVGSYLAFPGRIEREDWVGQAKVLAADAQGDVAAASGATMPAASKS